MSLLSFSLDCLASPQGDIKHGCFAQHLREAIALNTQRLPIYSQLSNGESEWISKKLIRYEKLGLLAAYYFDWKAKSYQKQGIPILCDEFVSMRTVPEIQTWVSSSKNYLQDLPRLDGSYLKDQIKDAYTNDGFEGIARFLETYLPQLEIDRPHHCMVKHLLESILRASRLAPQHNTQALQLGLSPTFGLSWDFIRLQLGALTLAEGMDFDTLPIHSQGVSIICGDVPSIH